MSARTFHDLLRRETHVFITTIMKDGSPHTTMTWVDTDGEHALVNIPAGTLKARNIARDPRVSLAVADPDNPRHYLAARATAAATTEDHGMAHFDQLVRKYLGRTLAELGAPTHERLVVAFRIESIHEAQ
ncbi:TIGR03618 family F420-dependent PPOX class oxidoreductase [Mycolicibacterium sp. 3033]|nr:TIGR03618 family F420-dependent PPOX class oxidoreductase [Mycolicibacterium aurantiacum]